MSTRYATKSGKPINAPALFVNPQTETDARILRRTVQDNPSETAYIEGIVVSLKDYRLVRKGLAADQTMLTLEALQINDRIKTIEPSLHILFQGASNDKEELMNVPLNGRHLGDIQLIPGGLRLRDVVAKIKSFEPNQQYEKIVHHIKEVYPYMDLLIQPIMELAINEDSDFVVVPSVPITISNSLIDFQVEKARSMNRTGKVLANTVFPKAMEKRDLMFLLTINPSVLRHDNFDKIISTLIIEEKGKETVYPDQIGIRIMNLDKNKIEEIQTLLDFLAKLAETLKVHKKQIPIHLLNVRNFGYVALCYGATTVTTPIAKEPYLQISSPTTVKDRKGRFYHPEHMVDYKYEKCLALSRPFGYVIPCFCKICKEVQTFLSIQEPAKWNEFRRIHFLLAKSIEIEEIKKAPASTLNRHLQQKFSRSKDTVWVAFLDKVPVLTFK
jgi:hypothetical protein